MGNGKSVLYGKGLLLLFLILLVLSFSSVSKAKELYKEEDFNNQVFPGRVETHLYSYTKLSTLLDNFVEGSNKSSVVSTKSDVSVARETRGIIVDVQNSKDKLSVGIILIVVVGIGITTLLANYFRDMK